MQSHDHHLYLHPHLHQLIYILPLGCKSVVLRYKYSIWRDPGSQDPIFLWVVADETHGQVGAGIETRKTPPKGGAEQPIKNPKRQSAYVTKRTCDRIKIKTPNCRRHKVRAYPKCHSFKIRCSEKFNIKPFG